MVKNKKFDGMILESPAKRWVDATPIGNGRMGGLVFGDVYEDRVIFTNESLFLPIDGRVELPNMRDILEEVRRLIRLERNKEASELFVKTAQSRGLLPYDKSTSRFYPDPFIPAFELKIKRGHSCFENYSRGLDFSTGESFSSWKYKDVSYSAYSFISMSDNIFVQLCENNSKDGEDISLSLEKPTKTCEKDEEYMDKYISNCKRYAENNILTFYCEFSHGGGYCGKAHVFSDGDISVCENILNVRNSHKTTVTVTLQLFGEEENAFLDNDYRRLFERHKEVYKSLYDGTRIELDENIENSYMSNESLLKSAKLNGISPALVEKLTSFGRCAAIMSTGIRPPNAQGIWNGSLSSGMLADYVWNIELEITTWQLLPGGLDSLMRAFLDYAETMVADWRENARLYYNCSGILVSSRTTNYGQLHHFSSEYPHMFWTAGAAWIARSFWEYYEFVGDKEYLTYHAYPFMKEAFEFYRDFLTIDDGHWNEVGKLCFIPSVSPENSPMNTGNMAACNAVMDIAALRELCENLMLACKELNDEEYFGKVYEVFDMLPNYLYNESGSLREWASNSFEDSPNHRHISHLYPLYPSHEAVREGGSLIKGCKQALIERIENNFLGSENMTATACGWSLVHALNAAARLEDDELFKKLFDSTVKGFLNDNLFGLLTENGNVFQIDVNLGLPAAVYEMLLYSDGERIKLLPCIPKNFTVGRAYNIHCKGGVLVSELEWDLDSKYIKCRIKSNKKQKIKIEIPLIGFDETIFLSDDAEWCMG